MKKKSDEYKKTTGKVYKESSVYCKSCGTIYPASREKCPDCGCKEQNHYHQTTATVPEKQVP